MAAPNVKESLQQLVAALLGISTFSPPTQPGVMLGDEATHAARRALGGALEPIPEVRLRWYPPDIERAQRMASNGDLTLIGQLCESMKLDGVCRGLSDARTSVVAMPKRFYGSDDVIDVLRSKTQSDRDVYDEMIPQTEAALMAFDGLHAGVGIGEMVPVKGRNFPVLVRRFPQNLFFMWSKSQWFYRSVVGLMPIQPGIPDENGNAWVLHIPGGRLAPWNSGLWNTAGRSYINKTQSIFARQSYEMKHSHPARVATSAMGATEAERLGFLNKVIRWAMNSAFDLPPGWDLKLVESNGRGIDLYDRSIDTSDKEMATAICGSSVMLQGTVGFGNMDPFQIVNMRLLRSTASGWDHTVNTQILPAFIGGRWGVDALENATCVETDVTEPADRGKEATTLSSLGTAVNVLVDALDKAQRALGVTEPVQVNVGELFARFGVPTLPVRVGAARTTAPSSSPAAAA